jgi:hypothetical protein
MRRAAKFQIASTCSATPARESVSCAASRRSQGSTATIGASSTHAPSALRRAEA